MVSNNIPDQDDESIEIEGLEETVHEDEDDEPATIELGPKESDDVSDDEVDDEEDLDDTDEEEPVKAAPASVNDLDSDEDVKYEIEHLEEQRKAAEFYLHQAREADHSVLKEWGLERFPITDGGRAINVYKLSEDEFDALIDRLEESDGVAKATIRSIQKNRARYDAKLEAFEGSISASTNGYHNAEWGIITQKAPKIVKDNWDKIAQHLLSKQGDPVVIRRAETFKGKLSLVNLAIRELRLTEKQGKDTKEAKKRPASPVHSAQTAGKTRKNEIPVKEITSSWIRSLTPEQFEKYEPMIDRARKAGKIKS